MSNLYDEFKGSLRTMFIEFMNEKLTTVPDKGKSCNELYLKNGLLFEYEQGDKKTRWAENAAAQIKRVASDIYIQLKA